MLPPNSCGALRGQWWLRADTWPQALAIQARPANMPAAARALAGLADDVWHAAGDTSADYNWCALRLSCEGRTGSHPGLWRWYCYSEVT